MSMTGPLDELGDLVEGIFDPGRRDLRRDLRTVREITALGSTLRALDDSCLRGRADQLRAEAADGADPEEQLVASFALTREVARRALGRWANECQLLGGIVAFDEQLAEMRAGEGSSLALTFPAVLRALSGEGVHVLTARAGSAERDAAAMAPLYTALGLTVAAIGGGCGACHEPSAGGTSRISSRQAYECDLTYGPIGAVAHDYLADQMVTKSDQQVQRGLHAAIVLDADRTLLEDGERPVVVSRPGHPRADLRRFAELAAILREGIDFAMDVELVLLPPGAEALAGMLGTANIYVPEHAEALDDLRRALQAQVLFRRGRDYLVEGDHLVLLDRATGSREPGSRLLNGLQEAVEAKEGLEPSRPWESWARITPFSLVRLYDSLGAFAGAALPAAAVFDVACGLDVVPIPRDAPCRREDWPDRVLPTSQTMLTAVVDDVRERLSEGRPVVVGGASPESGAGVARLLRERGIEPRVLPDDEDRAAEVFAGAGRGPTVTVLCGAPPAGVEVDVPPDVEQLGGIHVIGVEHAVAEETDEALRDLAGVRAEAGSSQFFTSAEDPLFTRLAREERMTLAVPGDQRAVDDRFADAVADAQQQALADRLQMTRWWRARIAVEDEQRELLYDELDHVRDDDVREALEGHVQAIIEKAVERARRPEPHPTWAETLIDDLRRVLPLGEDAGIPEDHLEDDDVELIDFLVDAALDALDDKEEELGGGDEAAGAERRTMLHTICRRWRDHLSVLDQLRVDTASSNLVQPPPATGIATGRVTADEWFEAEAWRQFDALTTALPRACVRAVFHARAAGG